MYSNNGPEGKREIVRTGSKFKFDSITFCSSYVISNTAQRSDTVTRVLKRVKATIFLISGFLYIEAVTWLFVCVLWQEMKNHF